MNVGNESFKNKTVFCSSGCYSHLHECIVYPVSSFVGTQPRLYSRVIRGEADWKHARPAADGRSSAASKAVGVWQRLNATAKSGAPASEAAGDRGVRDGARGGVRAGGGVKGGASAAGSTEKSRGGSLWGKARAAAKLSAGVTVSGGGATKTKQTSSSLWGKAGAAAKLAAAAAATGKKGGSTGGGGGGKSTADRNLWTKFGTAAELGAGRRRGGGVSRGGFDAVHEEEEEEEWDGEDEVYAGVLDRSRFHPERYESKVGGRGSEVDWRGEGEHACID